MKERDFISRSKGKRERICCRETRVPTILDGREIVCFGLTRTVRDISRIPNGRGVSSLGWPRARTTWSPFPLVRGEASEAEKKA